MNKTLQNLVLALGFIALPLSPSVSARNTTAARRTDNPIASQTTGIDGDQDWDWLVLFRLLGLAGLTNCWNKSTPVQSSKPLFSR
jgi:hypothetical protein